MERLIIVPNSKATGEAKTRRCARAMSALGHKQTFRTAIVMSALAPEANICGALAYVCFGPKADMAVCGLLKRTLPYVFCLD